VGGYLRIEGCDGALVGGASINPYKFAAIIDAAYRLQLDNEQAGDSSDET
jgi:triosephosphate isomerase